MDITNNIADYSECATVRKEEFAEIVKIHTLYRGDCESAKASGEISGCFLRSKYKRTADERRGNNGNRRFQSRHKCFEFYVIMLLLSNINNTNKDIISCNYVV